MVNVDASCSDDVVPSLAFEESSAAADVSRSSAVSGLDEAIGSSIGTPEDPDDVWRLVGFRNLSSSSCGMSSIPRITCCCIVS